MTYEQMQEKAYSLTATEVAKVRQEVISAYRTAYREILAELERQYATVLAGVAPEAWYNEMIKYGRLQKLTETLSASYAKAARDAGRLIPRASSLAMSNNYYRNQYATLFALGPGPLAGRVLPVLNEKLIQVAVLGTPETWAEISAAAQRRIEETFGQVSAYQPKYGTLTDVLVNNQRLDQRKIQSVVTQNLIQGRSFAQGRAEIRKILDTTVNNADRIIRTESHRTQSLGHYANYKATVAAGVEVWRKIVATLDDRTRAQSAAVDGQIDKTGEGFEYPNGNTYLVPGNTGVPAYDINDRERVIQIIPGEEPDERRGRDPVTGENEVMSYRNFDQWAREKGLKENRYGEMLPV